MSVKSVNGSETLVVSRSYRDLLVSCSINEVEVCCLVDTGAVVTILSVRAWKKIHGGDQEPSLQPSSKNLFLADDSALLIDGEVELCLSFGNLAVKQTMIVADIHVDALLGMDFLSGHGCQIDIQNLKLIVGMVSIPLRESPSVGKTCVGVIREDITIPPWSEMNVPVQFKRCGRESPIGVVETVPKFLYRYAVMAAHSLIDLNQRNIVVRMCNFGDEAQVLRKGTEAVGHYAADWIGDCSEDQLTRIHEVGSGSGESSSVLPEHLRDLWERAQAFLSLDEAERLRSLLTKYKDRFTDGKGDFGRTGEVKHEINTGMETPIKLSRRRIPIHLREEADKIVEGMLEQKVIEPSSSPWGAPTVLVKKKDGSLRYCVDYRKLNDVTKKDAYPLPRIDDTFDSLGGAQWFSTLDLCSGYWQVELSDSAKEKTAFFAKQGLYQFTVMPFGLCNAPATFERLMERVLHGLQWDTLLIYLDDVIIFSHSIEEGMERLEEVLQRFRGANLKLKSKKCNLFQREVRYLGHLVSAEGVATDPEKVSAVRNWPIPVNLKELRSFVGLCAYYRRFIKGFSQVAKPLFRLTEKGKSFLWDETCNVAFETLKACLTEAPILAFPIAEEPFILDTDASDVAIGAVLSQVQGDNERVIAYASRSLSKAERSYCVTRRELLAVVEFTKHFRHFLVGRQFTLRTDHGSLRWLYNFHDPEGQVCRWIEKLSEYSFSVVHRPGKQHGNADGLSRIPCRQCGAKEGTDVARVHVIAEETPRSPWIAPYCDEEIVSRQKEDQILARVLELLALNSLSKEDISSEPRTVRRYLQHRDTLRVVNGLLVKLWKGGDREEVEKLILPVALRKEVFRMLHNGPTGGHLGQKRTYLNVANRFHWIGMKLDIEEWCSQCVRCAQHSGGGFKAPLQRYIIGAPFQRVAMDLTGPFPLSRRRNRYVVVIVDYFTKWTEAYALPDMEAKTVARVFVEEFCCRFGVPEEVHTDQGGQFRSALYHQLCCLLGISRTRTTAYHPMSDGLVERFNRTLKSMLAKLVNERQNDWDEHLPYALLAYRSSIHSSTGFTPNMLMFGREAKLPVDLLFTRPKGSKSCISTEFVEELQRKLDGVHCLARENIRSSFLHQKGAFDRRCAECTLRSGDRVWVRREVHTARVCHKLACKWDGPFLVMAKLSPALFRIAGLKGSKSRVVHANRLKKFAGVGDSEAGSVGTQGSSVAGAPMHTELEQVERGPARRGGAGMLHPRVVAADGSRQSHSLPGMGIEPCVSGKAKREASNSSDNRRWGNSEEILLTESQTQAGTDWHERARTQGSGIDVGIRNNVEEKPRTDTEDGQEQSGDWRRRELRRTVRPPKRLLWEC